MTEPHEWQLDVEPAEEETLTPRPPLPRPGEGEKADEPSSCPLPSPEGARGRGARGEGDSKLPPAPTQILEAMLFAGGPPLTAAKACSAVRGLSPDRFRELIDELARTYRRQNRPCAVQPRDDGFILAVKPQYRAVREKLFGGPREARLTQPALDVLSLVTYRQPLAKAEVDTLRGIDSAGVLRQLVRLGLIAVTQRADAEQKTVAYGTTARFLDLFGLGSLDDLPRLADTSQPSG